MKRPLRRITIRLRGAMFALGLLLAPLSAFAQNPADDYVLVGAALRVRPAYDGSAYRRAELIPVLRYYGQPWFARTTQGVLEGGVRKEIAPGLNIGAQLAYESGRSTSESAFLSSHGVSSLNPGASFGLHIEWDWKFGPMPVSLLLRGRQHADTDRGAQADLRLNAGVYSGGGFVAGVFAQATWANAKSAQSFYGITQQQAAATGLPAFDAGSGPLFASLGLLWSADINREWVAVGSLEARHLQGDAARSPLAERTWNYYAGAGIAYRF